MSTEEIIRAWKSEDGEEKETEENAPVNPAGEELSEEELESVEGGVSCNGNSCFITNA